MSNTVSVVR